MPETLRFLSLFSGIQTGGLDLGLERAGWTCVGQVEIDEFCQRVLAKHWPGVPRWSDVRAVDAAWLRGVGPVDAIVGGFPCQDVSVAGKGMGLAGERSGLWFEYLRLVQEVRPDWVLVENVPGLRTRGADEVLAGLDASGYACWPLVVGADDVGAPHRRKRVWIVAYRSGSRLAHRRQLQSQVAEGADGIDGERPAIGRRQQLDARVGASGGTGAAGRAATAGAAVSCAQAAGGDAVAHRLGDSLRDEPGRRSWARGAGEAEPRGDGAGELGDSLSARLAGRQSERGDARGQQPAAERAGDATGELPDAEGCRRAHQGHGGDSGSRAGCDGPRWPARPGEPQHDWEAPRLLEFGVGGTADGLSAGLVRAARRRNKLALKAYGNAVVPACAEAIGRAITQTHRGAR